MYEVDLNYLNFTEDFSDYYLEWNSNFLESNYDNSFLVVSSIC